MLENINGFLVQGWTWISLCCQLPQLEMLLSSRVTDRSRPKNGVHKSYQSICCIHPPPFPLPGRPIISPSLPSQPCQFPPSSLISFLHSSFHWSRPDKGRFCKGECFQGRKVEFQKSLSLPRKNWNREFQKYFYILHSYSTFIFFAILIKYWNFDTFLDFNLWKFSW